MSEAELKRLRSSIVSSLYFQGGPMAVPDLRRDLERTHGIVATAVAVRSALVWLEQADLVRQRDDRALLTEMGQDVGALRIAFPE